MLSFREKYSYGIGALGKDLACSIVFVYIMFYFTDIVGLSAAFAGSVLFIARFWDAVNDIFMGVIVDNTRTKWGKFRPWILIGTLINAVIMVFLFKKPDMSGTSLAIYFAVFYILWGMTYTIMDIPYWSMLPSLSSNVDERNKIAVIPRIFASIAWFIMGTFGIVIVNKLGNVTDTLSAVEKANAQSVGFFYFALSIAIVFVICTVITVLNVKERTVVPPSKDKVTFKKAIDLIKSNDQLLTFIGVLLAFNMVSQLSGGVALYYFKYTIGNEDLYPVYSGFSGIAEISGLFLFPIISKKLSKLTVYSIACGLPVVGFTLLLISGLIFPQNATFIAISGFLFKLGSGFALGTSTVMLADVVDYGEYKLNSRNESIIFSMQTLLVKIASAFSGWLIGMGLTLVGYQANMEPSYATIQGIRFLMIGIPIILSIISFIIYKKFFKIKGEFHVNMLKELEKKRAENAKNLA